MDESLIDPFLEEADEKLQEMNEALLQYEEEQDEDALTVLFRSAHTLKSSSATMDFDSMSRLAHLMEDVFEELRENEIAPDDDLFTVLYNGIDALEGMVDRIRETRDAPDRDIGQLAENLERVRDGKPIDTSGTNTNDGTREQQDIQHIKVDVDRMDRLMNAVGELLITQKKLRAIAEQHETPELRKELGNLERLSDDLRYEISQARMVPVSQVFDRFPRIVRDIANKTGKDVSLTVEGDDLRMDRSIVEELGAPLIHIMRNAIDHGIEPPEERDDLGKPREGQVTLRAWQDGDEAVISVSDDGKGVDAEAVREQAMEQGLVTEKEASELDPDEIIELLFNPSFSTRTEVTELSGRGVGMNVVKDTARKLHGAYEVETTQGEGTTIQLRLPLTLAVVRCFVVQAGNQQFGVPINSVIRCLEKDEISVKKIESQDVFIYEDTEIPLIHLHNLVEQSTNGGEKNVMVLQHGKDRAGLVVDSITDVQEFVSKDLEIVKPSAVAGAAIQTDGTPVVILDTGELFSDGTR